MSIFAELGRRCQAGDRERENIDEWTNSDMNQCTAAQVSRISALLLIFKTILPDHLFLLWPREVWRKETRNIILKSSMKTNSNTQMCCAVLRSVTRNCCQHCRLCFDNVAGLSSCAGCCVSLFSSRSWAPMITNCLEWLPSSLCYPHIPRLTAPRPATIKHDITRTDTMIPGSSIQSILGVASLSIIIHHYTGGHLQIILSQQHSDCQNSVPICAINEMISMQWMQT